MEPDTITTHKRKFDPYWPHGHVTVRDGFPARIICRDGKCHWPIVALVLCSDGEEAAFLFTEDGRCHGHPDFWLVNAPAPKKRFRGWVNVYFGSAGWVPSLRVQSTREEADKSADPDRIACIYLDIGEGDGLL